jgi:tRNA (guanine-N7-)-methyltransferase
MSQLDPKDFIITRKRKKYKFALFSNNPLCFEIEEWSKLSTDIVEMGAGTGYFSTALAVGDQLHQYTAIDVKADRLQSGAARALSENISNIRFLRARGDQLPELFAAHSVQSIWITFPDPFPKTRSSGRRLTHPTFLAVYEGLLKRGGALYFKTDATNLFTWSLEQLVSEGWSIKELSFDLHESNLPDAYKIKTTYETRYMDEGIKINFVKALPPKR